MEGAFTGKYLPVDLTRGITAVEAFPELAYRIFMGGAAMAAAILMRELKPGVDPLGPDNIPIGRAATAGTTASSGPSPW